MTPEVDDGDEHPFGTLSASECRRRLTAGTIGRVAWNAAGGPHVLPVTYGVYEDAVVFRTAAYGVLAELRQPQPVAFEIDEIDTRTRSGWSVMVNGRSRAVAGTELARLWAEADPVPWASGTRTLFISISIDQISGRAIGR